MRRSNNELSFSFTTFKVYMVRVGNRVLSLNFVINSLFSSVGGKRRGKRYETRTYRIQVIIVVAKMLAETIFNNGLTTRILYKLPYDSILPLKKY